MTARQWLEIGWANGAVEARPVTPHPETREVGVVTGVCPGCGAEPFLIRASAPSIVKRDTLRGNGRAECCGDPVGYVYAQRETLFGLEEDWRMLDVDAQRARVYR